MNKNFSDIEINKEVERVCHEMVARYQREGILDDWEEQKMFGSYKESGAKERIRELLISGFKVKGGYRCTSVREYHTAHIFYKKKSK